MSITIQQQTRDIPRVPWDLWFNRFAWYQGQHVVIIAQTGGGKSTLTRHLINKRDHAVVLASKPADDTYDKYLESGMKRIHHWPPPKPTLSWLVGYPKTEYFLLWPKIKGIDDLEEKKLRPIFEKCLRGIFKDRNWCVVLADTYYLAIELKLAKMISTIQYQVRSVGVSEVCELQRPAWVPRSTWGQSSHSFLQMLSDLDDLAVVRGLYRMTTRELMAATYELAPYEWLYRNIADPFSKPMIIKPPPLEALSGNG